MPKRNEIPIKNIFYMLSYAWNDLTIKEDYLVDIDDFDNIYNLFARIYIKALNSIIKRGLNKYYIEVNDSLSTIRGRINIQESINRLSLMDKKLICEYEEFSQDININQILKSTIDLLLRNEKVDNGLKNDLKNLSHSFSKVTYKRLSKDIFKNLRFNRSNIHYKLLINISKFIYEGLLVEESETGEIEFLDFIRDEQMAYLYENFILNFYKYHLESNRYKVHSPYIQWKAEDSSMDKLPRMETDIVIRDKLEKKKLIIDTKYYKQTLTSKYEKDLGKIHSSHLYQIFAYVKNSKYQSRVSGMLLYPRVEYDIDEKYIIDNEEIFIKTIDLSREWKEIERELLAIEFLN